MKIYLGDKFYKYNEGADTFITIRVEKFKNENFLVCKDEKGNSSTYSVEELKKEYTKLKPSGLLSFNIVELNDGMKDVIVSLYRMSDLAKHIDIPYCTCRQNIFDLFSDYLNNSKTKIYVGMSLSIETTPSNVPYITSLACNKVEHSEIVSVYLEDTLDKMLSYVKVDKFDHVLNKIADSINNLNAIGYCRTLKELLDYTNFMFDFNKAFNIYQVPFEIKLEDEYTLDLQQTYILEEILKVQMFRTYVTKFNYDINLKKIQREHILVCDKSNNIYIVAYDKGEYINRTYEKNFRDKRDMVAMIKYKHHKNI